MGGGFWDPKSIKNRSQNEVGQGRRPGIDFHAKLVDFGGQKGSQNLLNNYSKMCLEMDTAPRRLQKLLEAARSSNNRFPVGFSEARRGWRLRAGLTRDSLPGPLKALFKDPTHSSSCNQDSGPRTQDPGYRTQDSATQGSPSHALRASAVADIDLGDHRGHPRSTWGGFWLSENSKKHISITNLF